MGVTGSGVSKVWQETRECPDVNVLDVIVRSLLNDVILGAGGGDC